MKQSLKRLFLDTEFTGLTQDTSLISLAIVADSGEQFYAEFTDFNSSKIADWLQENVIDQLFLNKNNTCQNLAQYYILGTKTEIAKALKLWIAQFRPNNNDNGPFLQIWADVPHYDWVLFCELFGGAFGLPDSIHYMPMDMATLLFIKGIDLDIDREALANTEDLKALKKHNALYDTLVIKSIFENLENK